MLPEELIRLFFTENQFQKLLIINELYYKKLHISDLERDLKKSRKNAKRIIGSLQMDITEYNKKINKNLSMIVNKDKIYFSPNILDEEYLQLKSFFHEKYLLTSGLYRSLMFVLERRNFSVTQLADYLSYSESYTYKLLNEMRRFFTLIDIGITISKKDDTTLYLKGEEIVIRLLHYLTISITLVKDDWPFQTISEVQIKFIHSFINSNRIRNFSPSNLKKLNIILAIYEVAKRNGYTCDKPISSVQSVGSIINKEKELQIYLNYLQKKEIEETCNLHGELSQLGFILNYFIPELRTKEEKIILGKELVSNKKNPIIHPCVLLIDKIRNKYQLTEDTYNLLTYFLCNNLIVIHYLKLYKFMKYDEIQFRKGKIEKFIECAIYKSFKEYRNSQSFDYLMFNFTQIITSHLSLISDISIYVYIEFQRRPEYKLVIENALNLNYSEQSLKIVENYEEADIIISDTYFEVHKQKFFYFRNIFDHVAWRKLGLHLNEIIKNDIVKRIGE